MTAATSRNDPLFTANPAATVIELSLLLACFTGIFQFAIGFVG